MGKTDNPDWMGNWCAKGRQITACNTVSNDLTFVAATSGAIASKEIFTVTGIVVLTVFGVCSDTLTSGAVPTIEVGTATTTTRIIGAAAGLSIDQYDVFVDETAIGESEEPTSEITWVLTYGDDIVYRIRDATITGGTIVWYCLWYPLSDDGLVVSAGFNASAA